jgi:hypothetical protein
MNPRTAATYPRTEIATAYLRDAIAGGGLYAVGDFGKHCREAVAQARLTLSEACDKANASRDTYTIRRWDDVAQAARRVLVAHGALPPSSL